MKGNMPRGFALAPKLCKTFPKEPIGGFWGKLWISTTSHGFFSLVITEQKHFIHLHPPIPPHLLHVAPLVGLTMFLHGGGDVTIGQTRIWQLWDHEHQGRFMGVEQSLVTLGH
jgi:hypothetical protein